MVDLPGAVERVERLMSAGLVVASPRPDRNRTYAIDTRDSVSPAFREIVVGAVDLCRTGGLQVAAVASSGTLLCALWAGATGNPFWNVRLTGPRARGFGREVEPSAGVAGTTFVLVDNHVRTGASLRAAVSVLEAHGGVVARAMVLTAGDHVDIDLPLSVALPHRHVIEALRCEAEARARRRPRSRDSGACGDVLCARRDSNP